MSGDSLIKNIACPPVQVLQIELALGFDRQNVPADHRYRSALILVRLHGQALGVVECTSTEEFDDPGRLAELIWRNLQDAISAHLREDGVHVPARLDPGGVATGVRCHRAWNGRCEPVTVVVATRDRPMGLKKTVDSLLGQDYPDFQVIVVDNAPSSDATEQVYRQHYAHIQKVRYVREETQGLGIARNRGLLATATPLVAFTDDDVLADRHWLTEINRAFHLGKNVACVTGLIIPSELETEVQLWADARWRWGKGFQAKLFDLGENRVWSDVYPYSAGVFGTGANMAFRTSVLRTMGGFDPALGTGSRAKGGEDLAAFFETIYRGYQIAYEPSAIIHHSHHRDLGGLKRQAYSYGVGLTAYLSKALIDHPSILFDMVRRMPRGIAFFVHAQSANDGKYAEEFAHDLISLERRGLLSGPPLYLWSRWRTRKHRRALSSR